MTADIDGTVIGDIRTSEYVKPGVELHLGAKSIRPGTSGTLHLRAHVKDMVFQDSSDDSYASVKFSPTWYDGAHGRTYLEVSFYLPPGVTTEEPRYHDEQFTTARVEGDRIVYTWERPDAFPDRQYMFGASFPKQYVDRIAETTFDWEGTLAAIIAVVIIAAFLVVFVGGFLGLAVWSVRSERRRRLEYLPPKLSVEGVEVRRGLTAPEAAVLMQMPLNKVLSLISFGLIRKNALRVLSRKPLRVEAIAAAPDGLHPYEAQFVAAVQKDGILNESALRTVVVDLVQSINRKMKGFSHRETVAYYRSIIAKAWERVQTADEGDLSDEILGETIEWTSLDRDFERRAPEVWVGRTYRQPRWWPNYMPRRSTSPGGGGSGAPLRLPDVTMPRLPGSEFASTVVGGLEGFADGMVRNIESFTASVTEKTNPPPPPSRSGSSGRSGGGCACACACAGCACACAGGGR